MRLLLTRPLCVIAAAALCALPAAARADGGGASAPSGPRTDAGGSSYEEGYAQAERAERAERRRRLAAQRRRAAARARKREAARRQALARQRAVALDPSHRFPVAGTYTLGGADGRFGAKRPGHRHQGQDVAATLGTPVVAPWEGTVESVRYQRGGAGWYVVLQSDAEYVFMHLRRGSILVTPGQHVGTGEQLAEVGSTGRSTGPHLHFEVWIDGTPVDPLPLLQSWAT